MISDFFTLTEKFLKKHLPDPYNPGLILDEHLEAFKPWQIAFLSVILFCCVKTTWNFFTSLPDRELGEAVRGLEADVNKQIGKLKYKRNLPEKGWGKQAVLNEISKYMELGPFKVEKGNLSGACHKPPNVERVETVTGAYELTAFANPLNPDAFPGIRKMEAEVVRMALNMCHGDENACGTMTSGGTESLILACKAYRDFARATRGVLKPNIVMPVSGHIGFDKAAHILGFTIKKIPLDPITLELNLRKFEKAVDANTIMVVASAPQYPQGIMDPIEAIGQIALRKNVPFHVDACLGGFLIAFLEEAGFEGENFDFQVPGVTSISVDTHKVENSA